MSLLFKCARSFRPQLLRRAVVPSFLSSSSFSSSDGKKEVVPSTLPLEAEEKEEVITFIPIQEAKAGASSGFFSPAVVKEEDLIQVRELDTILTERAARFYDPSLVGVQKELCLLISVEIKLEARKQLAKGFTDFTHLESLSELSELVGTAGLQVKGIVVQKLSSINSRSYVGPGKIEDIMKAVNATGANTLVIDDDLTPKQQRNLETLFAGQFGGKEVKILDRTAIILEIFAQHAKSREGQLQVELAMLEYRLTRGPSASGDVGRDSGAGFRGPGESKLETDKRIIKTKILLLKEQIEYELLYLFNSLHINIYLQY